MKGHLGTKLQDKSEIVIGVSVDKENDYNRIVQSLASRNRKPDPFEFTIQESGIPIINEYEVSSAKLTGKKQQKTDKPDYQLFEILTTVFSKKIGEINYYRYTELSDQIILEYEKKFNDNLGLNNAKKLITKFIDNGWVIKSGEKGFSLYYIGEFNTPF